MKRAAQVAIGVFAIIGLGYTALMIYANWVDPHCQFVPSAEARSPDGQHFAVFQQTICQDPARSRSTVEMGGTDPSRRITRLQISGTSDVDLTWNGDRELVVSFPNSALVKEYGPYDDWPRVTVRKRGYQ
jgi:hypothetical protein